MLGGNGSYNKAIGGIPINNRTHTDTGLKIDGHKVVISNTSDIQAKNILNSNSDSPIYVIGHVNRNHEIVIHSVNVFEGHHIKMEINIKYDANGRILAYNGKEKNSHCHYWQQDANGNMSRKLTGNAHERIPKEYAALLQSIDRFNRQNHKFYGKHK